MGTFAEQMNRNERGIPCGRGTWFMKETGIQLRGNIQLKYHTKRLTN